MFGKVFFSTFSSTAGVLASLGTFAVGFVARPVGAILFGHWGDRIGRKSMLVTSLLVMGLSTVAAGLVPDYGTLGLRSPILLTVGFYIRIKIAETLVFQAALDKSEQAKVPMFELVRIQPRVLVLSTLSFVLAHALSVPSRHFVFRSRRPRSASRARLS